MTKTPYTPGPWAVLDGAIYGSATGPIHNGKTCAECEHAPTECGPLVIAPIDPDILPDVKAGYWDDAEPPSAADLRLIAAAPELLQALIAITDQLERVGDTRQHKDGQYIDDARAAIAKATGEKGQPK